MLSFLSLSSASVFLLSVSKKILVKTVPPNNYHKIGDSHLDTVKEQSESSKPSDMAHNS